MLHTIRPRILSRATALLVALAALTVGLSFQRAEAAECETAGAPVHLPPLEYADPATVGHTRHTLIAAGNRHSVAVSDDGSVWAWGDNTYNKLGDPDFDDFEVPVPHRLPGINSAVSVEAGWEDTAVLLSNGTVLQWGEGSGRRLICPLTQVVEIGVGGMHALALRADGTVWAWNSDRFGERGDGEPAAPTDGSRASATQVPGLSDIKAIAAGGAHSLALRADGTVWAWGKNENAQLGAGFATTDGCRCVADPVRVEDLDDVVAIGAGTEHSLAITSDEQVWGWGSNGYGQLGLDGTPYPSPQTTPIEIPGTPPATAVDGGSHSVALATDGSVWGWGLNNRFQTGKDQSNGGLNHPEPTQVGSLGSTAAVSAGTAYADAGGPSGGHHTLALQTDGSVWGWGDRWWGQLGDNARSGSTWIPRQAQGVNAGRFDAEYVAFGDSITTGFSNVACASDRIAYADGCGEPAAAPATPYPAHVAEALELPLTRVGIWGYRAEDAVKAYAAGTNVYQADKIGKEGTWEPQLSSVMRATKLVTGGLGINDMEFSDVAGWAIDCISITLQVDEARCRAAATAKAGEVEPYVATIMQAMAVAEGNGAQSVATLYYNPFADLSECEITHGVAEVILDELNGMIASQAAAFGISVADLRAPFNGHGAGLEDLSQIWVVGTECNDLLGAWQGVMPDFLGGDKEAVAQEFDPHPNDEGTEAIAEAVLAVTSL